VNLIFWPVLRVSGKVPKSGPSEPKVPVIAVTDIVELWPLASPNERHSVRHKIRNKEERLIISLLFTTFTLVVFRPFNIFAVSPHIRPLKILATGESHQTHSGSFCGFGE
jgi:hypothetical protein